MILWRFGETFNSEKFLILNKEDEKDYSVVIISAKKLHFFQWVIWRASQRCQSTTPHPSQWWPILFSSSRVIIFFADSNSMSISFTSSNALMNPKKYKKHALVNIGQSTDNLKSCQFINNNKNQIHKRFNFADKRPALLSESLSLSVSL